MALADIDRAAASRAAAASRSDKAHAMSLDASKPEDLGRAMQGCDLVVNAALPRFNQGLKAACLAQGLDYMDLATESSDPFVDSDLWTARGRTALLGMGEDPGMSDVFARHAADGMDRVDSIRIRDGDTG